MVSGGSRDDVLYSLGLLAQPVSELIRRGSATAPELALARARFVRDLQFFEESVRRYCTVNDLFLQQEYAFILGEARKLIDCTATLRYPEVSGEAPGCLERTLAAFREYLDRVPLAVPTGVLPPGPVEAFVRLRSLCFSALHRVDILDPYLDADVYHRYLASVSDAVVITLVASEHTWIGGKGDDRKRRVLSVSELFAAARPNTYSLRVASRLHDRHARIDDQVLHLGTSLKDAGKAAPFTISLLPAEAGQRLDDEIASAAEWVGPTVRQQRQH